MTDVPSDKVISCFYETSEDCVKVVDADGILMSFNNSGMKVMEIDNASDVIGKSWLKFWDGDLANQAHAALEQALGGEPAFFEGFSPTLKGTMKYWKVSIMPMLDDDGVVSTMLITSKDTTNVLQLEKRIKDLEKQVTTLQTRTIKT